ncbi:methyltransferase family protein [Rhizorhapis suberifaciens]|uniref:Protein-S-isoprenylcysteine O-methyltransferase Ste14 n=1 Tax=Rhizorhapis suberifaciens TaxID=13656 RepID=A0A840HW64_9SPHN|nr:isoprenylcysteine carboxylmethyltransferase family protein [Rhizorhapis suberifaciens]MBB4641820.1 protein-S-isoprenylcysteine O-methyltransferase Ste14 [Rhizorhapis suberifaciens]
MDVTPPNESAACPPSAVSHGAGVVGLIGLMLWIAFALHLGMDGPYAGMAGVFACGMPMVLWSLLVDKVHLRPSTGIDWKARRPLRETLDISLVKLAGLWATWAGLAILYCLARWYWDGGYLFAMEMFAGAAPWLFGLSIPYVIWLDRHMIEPRDGTYAFGQLVVGAAGKPERAEVENHLRSWLVKGFFLAFMLSIVPGNFADMVHAGFGNVLAGPVELARFLIALMFVVDVAFATVGYMLTMKPLDAHIRTANPHIAGWVAALICYPPFVLMNNGGPLDYHSGTQDWAWWFAGHPLILWMLGGVLVALTAIYAWATVAFGLRFSNLTHRGILTHGPYRWSKHPAYLSKNLFWWLSTLPFLVSNGSLTDMVRNTALLGVVGGVYYWRARTEERHLLSDPDYRAYAEWMERNGVVPRAIAWMTGGKKRAAGELQAAE